MIIWSVESLVRMILGFLTSKWLFQSLSKPHLGFRSLVFFLSWQSHQATPFKHCYSLRAIFLAVLGASHLRLDMQLMPLDSLLKCWGFNSTHLQASCLPFWTGEQLMLSFIYLNSHVSANSLIKVLSWAGFIYLFILTEWYFRKSRDMAASSAIALMSCALCPSTDGL